MTHQKRTPPDGEAFLSSSFIFYALRCLHVWRSLMVTHRHCSCTGYYSSTSCSVLCSIIKNATFCEQSDRMDILSSSSPDYWWRRMTQFPGYNYHWCRIVESVAEWLRVVCAKQNKAQPTSNDNRQRDTTIPRTESSHWKLRSIASRQQKNNDHHGRGRRDSLSLDVYWCSVKDTLLSGDNIRVFVSLWFWINYIFCLEWQKEIVTSLRTICYGSILCWYYGFTFVCTGCIHGPITYWYDLGIRCWCYMFFFIIPIRFRCGGFLYEC